MNKLRAGAVISARELVTIRSERIQLPDPAGAELLAHQGDVPFAVVADPTRRLYAQFGVGSSPRALLDPRAWLAGVRAVASNRPSLPASRQQALGLPADFLAAADGHVLACKYGAHAYDQWSVDDLLQLAGQHIRPGDHRLRR
jgi:hypothetical protein